jgi:hypothetical protein
MSVGAACLHNAVAFQGGAVELPACGRGGVRACARACAREGEGDAACLRRFDHEARRAQLEALAGREQDAAATRLALAAQHEQRRRVVRTGGPPCAGSVAAQAQRLLGGGRRSQLFASQHDVRAAREGDRDPGRHPGGRRAQQGCQLQCA